VSVVTRWLSLRVDVMDLDESAHIVGSWTLLRGGLLYTDFVDNKPPLLYVYYALAQLVFGRGLLAVHLFTALVTVPAIACGLSAFYRHEARGIVAALSFLVFSAAFLAHDMLASNAEIPMLLPGVWAVVAVSGNERGPGATRVIATGLLLGTAFLLKYQIALWIPVLAAAAVWRPIRNRRFATAAGWLTLFGLGCAVPLVATWAWFLAHGGADALLYWTVVNNVEYASNPILATEAATRALGNLLPFVIVTAPLWWGWLESRHEYGSGARSFLVNGLVIASIPAAFIGFRFFPHYFVQLYPPLALAAAPWLLDQLRPAMTRAGRRVVAWTLVMLLGFMGANAILYSGNSGIYRERDPVYRHVAERLRRDSCAPDATLFVWGYAPIFYYLSGFRPASRFAVLAQSHLTPYLAGNLGSARGEVQTGYLVEPAHWHLLMGDLERNRATFIVDTSPAGLYRWNRYPIDDYPRLRAYLTMHYDLVADVDGVLIYRRLGCAGAPSSR
jgi:4-amino-4-deoxy-L-arabinose transferase-like glycosyltransferase